MFELCDCWIFDSGAGALGGRRRSVFLRYCHISAEFHGLAAVAPGKVRSCLFKIPGALIWKLKLCLVWDHFYVNRRTAPIKTYPAPRFIGLGDGEGGGGDKAPISFVTFFQPKPPIG